MDSAQLARSRTVSAPPLSSLPSFLNEQTKKVPHPQQNRTLPPTNTPQNNSSKNNKDPFLLEKPSSENKDPLTSKENKEPSSHLLPALKKKKRPLPQPPPFSSPPKISLAFPSTTPISIFSLWGSPRWIVVPGRGNGPEFGSLVTLGSLYETTMGFRAARARAR